jgi:hypothetical protein
MRYESSEYGDKGTKCPKIREIPNKKWVLASRRHLDIRD